MQTLEDNLLHTLHLSDGLRGIEHTATQGYTTDTECHQCWNILTGDTAYAHQRQGDVCMVHLGKQISIALHAECRCQILLGLCKTIGTTSDIVGSLLVQVLDIQRQ